MEGLASPCGSSALVRRSPLRTPTMMQNKPVATPRSAAAGGSSQNAMFPTKIPVSEPNVKNKLNYLFNKDSATIDSLKLTVQELESRKSEVESIIEYRSQLMQFEEERVRLLSKTQYTEKALRELELKHAKSMVHHNKQMTHHVTNLTIAERRKEQDKLRTENYQLRQKGMSHAGGSSKRQAKAQHLQTIVDKENPVAVNSNRLVVLPPIKSKPERQLSQASALKQRNGN